jgi:hypothetical protein
MTKEQTEEFFNQLVKLQEQINEIEVMFGKQETYPSSETECDGACECGCDESPVEIVESTYVVTEDDKYAGHVHLTRAEMIDFATRLTERVIESVKKAVTDMELNADDLVTLELSWSNVIEVELDNGTLTNNVNSEIEDAVNLDPDSISDEIDDIFGDMYLERIS